jgi:hypothetical protein
MSIDFADAARRHYADGNYLFQINRWANADQLFGLASECGLKAIMVGLDPTINLEGDLTRQYRKHINLIWNQVSSFAAGRSGARYSAILAAGDPFSDWHVIQRYYHSHHVTSGVVQPHMNAANSVLKALQQAQLDGII